MRALVLCMLCGCIGAGAFISPMEAHRIETEQCMRKANAEDQRICLGMVEKKYRNYFSEGEYPKEYRPRGPRD